MLENMFQNFLDTCFQSMGSFVVTMVTLEIIFLVIVTLIQRRINNKPIES